MADRPDPALLAFLREATPRLDRICFAIRGGGDSALYGLGITPEDLKWFRNEMPQLGFLVRNLLQVPSSVDPAELDVADRLRRYTAEEYAGCARWIGAAAGVRKDGTGSTPIISYQGKMVPARRLAWQLLHRGSDLELGPKDRLKAIGCRGGSLCMNLNHWRKAKHRPPLGDVRATLEAATEESDGKLCASGQHWIHRKAGYCPLCRAARLAHNDAELQAAHQAGTVLREQIRRMSPSE